MAVSLPPRTVYAAEQCRAPPWPLMAKDLMLHEDALLLAFGICRTLLPPRVLAQHFKVLANGRVWWLEEHEGRPATCMLSMPKHGARDRKRLSATGDVERQGLSAEEERLQAFVLPEWVTGRLRFRNDRWCFAPRQFAGNVRYFAGEVR